MTISLEMGMNYFVAELLPATASQYSLRQDCVSVTRP